MRPRVACGWTATKIQSYAGVTLVWIVRQSYAPNSGWVVTQSYARNSGLVWPTAKISALRVTPGRTEMISQIAVTMRALPPRVTDLT